ncbi:hypothetical protein HDV00_004484 [Rhizophlyctis rosea]|nr:hypothetical protein HDV00_004484 [Rhizophlyctis rosea]
MGHGMFLINHVVNYIEEQKPGVFLKTMRNMTYLVLFINPLLSLLALGILPRTLVGENTNNILSIMAEVAAGKILRTIVSVDAVIVLCGGVLTAFVGVGGLIESMAADHLLPSFLLKRNRYTKSTHWIILTFLALCILLVIATSGDITALSLMFSIAFLSVLLAFALSNILLKYRRGRLKRVVRASWGAVIFGLLVVVVAIVGNAIYQPMAIGIFAAFFVGLFVAMLGVLGRVKILRVLLYFADQNVWLKGVVVDRLVGMVRRLRSKPV